MSTQYTTTVTLETGLNYKFKVQSRNAVGYSLDSAEVIIRAARIPDIPSNILTIVNNDNVDISWTAPYNGGSVLLAY